MLRTVLESFQVPFAGLGVTFGFGLETVYANATPPCVVWVPTGDSVLDPIKISIEYDSIALRRCGVAAHVWGATFDQAEAVLHDLIMQIRKLGRGDVVLSAIDWMESKTGLTRRGWEGTLSFSIDIPVLNKMMAIPTTGPAVPPGPDTTVTVVSDTPGEGEAVVVLEGDIE